jgi:hypothetical protein
VSQLIAVVRDDGDTRLPDVARQVLQVLANQIEQIEAAVTALERQLLAWHKTNPVKRPSGVQPHRPAEFGDSYRSHEGGALRHLGR